MGASSRLFFRLFFAIFRPNFGQISAIHCFFSLWYFWLTIQNTKISQARSLFRGIAVFISFCPWRAAVAAACFFTTLLAELSFIFELHEHALCCCREGQLTRECSRKKKYFGCFRGVS
jgi:hypothetical protein